MVLWCALGLLVRGAIINALYIVRGLYSYSYMQFCSVLHATCWIQSLNQPTKTHLYIKLAPKGGLAAIIMGMCVARMVGVCSMWIDGVFGGLTPVVGSDQVDGLICRFTLPCLACFLPNIFAIKSRRRRKNDQIGLCTVLALIFGSYLMFTADC